MKLTIELDLYNVLKVLKVAIQWMEENDYEHDDVESLLAGYLIRDGITEYYVLDKVTLEERNEN